jgi:hypothetical protein
MSGMSSYLEALIMNAVFRAVAFVPPANIYLALYKSDPTDADAGLEVSGGSYARQSITFAAPIVSDGKTVIINTNNLQFAVATADWGTITHIGIRDAATDGHLLYSGELPNARSILTNDQFKVPISGLALKLQ